jgi:acetoin utilization protein AcuB
MLIADWMTRSTHTVKPLDSILHAREAMTRYRVNQLPVVRGAQLVGIVTDRDLRDAFPSVFDVVDLEIERERGYHRAPRRPRPSGADPAKITVDFVMTESPLALSPTDSMLKAATLMREKRIGALPIVETGRLVGILTRSDVLAAFLALAGAKS